MLLTHALNTYSTCIDILHSHTPNQSIYFDNLSLLILILPFFFFFGNNSAFLKTLWIDWIDLKISNNYNFGTANGNSRFFWQSHEKPGKIIWISCRLVIRYLGTCGLDFIFPSTPNHFFEEMRIKWNNFLYVWIFKETNWVGIKSIE